jgi:hypothetical protein
MMTRTAIKQVEARNRYFEWAKEWVLTDFGAAIYTLNLVVFRIPARTAILFTAILMAGRTWSPRMAEIRLSWEALRPSSNSLRKAAIT